MDYPMGRARRASSTMLFLAALSSFLILAAPVRGELAPVNPAFLAAAAEKERRGPDLNLGWIPSPLDLSHLARLPRQRADDPLPSVYDLRPLGRVSPVRDQGACGACWAFASLYSLESGLLPTAPLLYSVNHLKNTHGFDLAPCDGGNAQMAAAYFARRSGPVLESEDPYAWNAAASPPDLPPRLHVRQVLYLPPRLGPLDNEALKRAVMRYGEVKAAMRFDFAAYDDVNNSHYLPTGGLPNHSPTLVGWDDAFPAERFRQTAPGPGAFIAKGSWGSAWGESGYFHISYYDAGLGQDSSVFADAVAPEGTVYQYDELGWIGSWGLGSETAWFAASYTAVADERITAIGFYAASPGARFEARLQAGPVQPPLDAPLPPPAAQGELDMAGFHFAPLDVPLDVTAGQRFGVAVLVNTPGHPFPVPLEIPAPAYSSRATAEPGETFVSADGANWTDISRALPNASVCLKAYGTPRTAATPSP